MVEFRPLDDQALVGRLSYISPENGKLLSLQSEWGFVPVMHPGVMEKQLREKRALSVVPACRYSMRLLKRRSIAHQPSDICKVHGLLCAKACNWLKIQVYRILFPGSHGYQKGLVARG
ncbi:MAG: hypothetical protein IPJ38_21460 [Dechloromonas sp.]|uniref:Uncharacterized protein n=1 Tax=Candidatus Dechloromonas phosphorivorans TaxID=2899244 RepID=A0A935MSM2_9RHOO|nr:hypothetical protein [Candidatus Dechloromonas phosphorivorans]